MVNLVREGDWHSPRRVDFPKDDVCESVTRLVATKPGLKDSGRSINPRHGDCRALSVSPGSDICCKPTDWLTIMLSGLTSSSLEIISSVAPGRASPGLSPPSPSMSMLVPMTATTASLRCASSIAFDIDNAGSSLGEQPTRMPAVTRTG